MNESKDVKEAPYIKEKLQVHRVVQKINDDNVYKLKC